MSGNGIHEMYSRGVFFTSDLESGFSYTAFCLADGLHQLGIPIYADRECTSSGISNFSFSKAKDPHTAETAYAGVYNLCDVDQQRINRVTSLNIDHERSIVISECDHIAQICLDTTTPFLCAHENRLHPVAGNRIPIAFGLSQRMLQESRQLPVWAERQSAIVKNFRPSMRQELRALMELIFIPHLSAYYDVSTEFIGTSRFGSTFYDFLKSRQIVLAYGGCIWQDLIQNPYFRDFPEFRRYMEQTDFLEESVVLRWDSWRFWESLVFGCVTVQLDFDRYGFMLPVMPENWTHYIGLNLANLKQDVERMCDERDRLPEIAINGRKWALQHYSPVAVAKRFIKLTCQLNIIS